MGDASPLSNQGFGGQSQFFQDGHGGCFIIRQRNASLAVFMTYSGLYVGGMVALLNCLWFPASISSRFQGVVGSHSLISLVEKGLHNIIVFIAYMHKTTGADWLQ